MEGSGKDSPRWLTLISGHVPILAATALFAFMIIKVLGIANGNAETAIAVMSSVGVAQVTLGVVVASYGLLLLVWIYWLVWWGVEAGFRHQSIWPSLIMVALVSVAVFALDSIFLGIVMLAGSVGTIVGARFLMSSFTHRGRTIMRSLFAFVGITGFLVFMSFSGQWLPTEVVVTDESDMTSELVGFVLNDSGPWVSVLTEEGRSVVRLRSESIVERKICTLDTDKFFGPSWVEVVGHDSEPVPLCSDVLHDIGRP